MRGKEVNMRYKTDDKAALANLKYATPETSHLNRPLLSRVLPRQRLHYRFTENPAKFCLCSKFR